MRAHGSIGPASPWLAQLALLGGLVLAPPPAHGATPATPVPSRMPRPCPPPGSPPDPAATLGCVPGAPASVNDPTGSADGPAATSGGGAAGGNAGGGSGGGSAGGSGGGESGENQEPLADVLPVGPFVVRQIETLGGERISGGTCHLGDAFVVNFATPKVAFSATFTPRTSPVAGDVSYRYSIPSAGESHDAHGTYSGQVDAKTRTVFIRMSVSDHVVFHHFDGNMPNVYEFELVSTPDAPCGLRR